MLLVPTQFKVNWKFSEGLIELEPDYLLARQGFARKRKCTEFA